MFIQDLKHHEQHCGDLGIDRKIEAYVQTRVLKMTFESMSMEYRRGGQSAEESRGAAEPARGTTSEAIPIPRIEIIA